MKSRNINLKQAEKIQNEIYRKMPATKKLKIAGDFFLLGKKLDLLKHENRKTRRALAPNSKNFR